MSSVGRELKCGTFSAGAVKYVFIFDLLNQLFRNVKKIKVHGVINRRVKISFNGPILLPVILLRAPNVVW
jgi:hypothetical protein